MLESEDVEKGNESKKQKVKDPVTHVQAARTLNPQVATGVEAARGGGAVGGQDEEEIALETVEICGDVKNQSVKFSK